MELISFNSYSEFIAHKAMLSFMYTIKKFKLCKSGAVQLLGKPKLIVQL